MSLPRHLNPLHNESLTRSCGRDLALLISIQSPPWLLTSPRMNPFILPHIQNLVHIRYHSMTQYRHINYLLGAKWRIRALHPCSLINPSSPPLRHTIVSSAVKRAMGCPIGGIFARGWMNGMRSMQDIKTTFHIANSHFGDIWIRPYRQRIPNATHQ